MIKPSIEEIEKYLIEKKQYPPNQAKSFADKFWNYYESVGWKIGDKKNMVSWTAAIRTWELKNKTNAHQPNTKDKPGTSEARIRTAKEW
jgi:hypothetical protein